MNLVKNFGLDRRLIIMLSLDYLDDIDVRVLRSGNFLAFHF